MEEATYKVKASKTGFTFTPAEVTEYLNRDTEVNFTGDQPTPPTGTLTATPNPVQVCDGSGQGVVTLNWTSGAGVSAVEIRKGAPNGPLVKSGGASGSFTTNKWVTNGMVFYLQNVTYGLPLTSANTLATVTVNVTTQGCPPPQTSFNKTVNYAYNSVGALSGVGTNLIGSDSNATTNVLNTVAYRGFGALKSLNYGNGRRLQVGYNTSRQQPVSMKVDMASNPSDKIIDYAYEYYDANGNNNNRILKITDNVDTGYTTNYTYDDYNRLSNASASAYSRSYFHDEWGNIKNFSGLTLNYATNASGAPATNRISTAVIGSTTYTHSYDTAGNMTGDGQQTFSYDGANRLKEVGTGGQNTYGYDGNGMRVRVVSGGGLPTFYVRSSVLGQVAFEVNQNLVLRAYVNAAGKVVAQQSRDGQFYWLHTNHLGSGTKLTDSTGAVKSRAEFDPYGQTLLEWSSSGDTNLNTKKYTGYERDDATGLDYANARMYNNGRGRFMQADPSWAKATNYRRPESLNRYTYVFNDPVNFIDPGGAIPIPIIGPCAITFCVKIATNEPGPDALPRNPRDIVPQRLPVIEPQSQQPIRLPIENLTLLTDAVNRAAQALQSRPECADLFGVPAEVGDQANFLYMLFNGNSGFGSISYGNLGGIKPDGTVTAANTTGILGSITREDGSKVSIFTGANIIINNNSSAPFFSGYGQRFGVDDSTNRAITLLHEIGHAAAIIRGFNSQIVDDQSGPQASQQNSQLVFDKCFK